jgi:hypothetical protein
MKDSLHQTARCGERCRFYRIYKSTITRVSYGFAEPSLKDATLEDHFQFQRIGYYIKDRDSSDEQLVFNRTVTLEGCLNFDIY